MPEELQEGSLNYFGILLELIAEPENLSVIIELSPELQSLVSPIT